MRLILAREVQSGNTFAYSHWKVRYRDKLAWECCMHAAMHLAKDRLGPPTGRRRVAFTAYRGRRLDDDNLVGGLKHARDQLVRFGLLTDDNAAGATFTYDQQLAKDSPLGAGRPCLVIDISEDA